MVVCFTRCTSEENKDALFPALMEKRWMYMNLDGKIAVVPQFIEAGQFHDGRAQVELDMEASERVGFIGEDGALMNAENFFSATRFSNGHAWTVKDGDFPRCMDLMGNEVFGLKDSRAVYAFNDDVAKVVTYDKSQRQTYFVDAKGNVQMDLSPDQFTFFSEGLCAWSPSGSDYWGFVNKSGDEVISPKFSALDQSSQGFQNGLCPASPNGKKWGVINKMGSYVINPQFDHIVPDNKSFQIRIGNKFGWCDAGGRISINPRWEEVGFFGVNELAPVMENGLWGYIDEFGSYVIKPQFEEAISFVAGKAWVKDEDMWGLIDKSGKYVVEPQFEMKKSRLLPVINSIYRRGYYESDSITSEFFDVEKIVSQIEIVSPHDIDIHSSKFEDLQKAFGSLDRGFVHILEHQEAFESVEKTFACYGQSYRSFKVRDGWWEKTEYEFLPDKSPEAYSLRFNLVGKGQGKAQEFFEGMANRLIDFKGLELGNARGAIQMFYGPPFDEMRLCQDKEITYVLARKGDSEIWLDIWLSAKD